RRWRSRSPHGGAPLRRRRRPRHDEHRLRLGRHARGPDDPRLRGAAARRAGRDGYPPDAAVVRLPGRCARSTARQPRSALDAAPGEAGFPDVVLLEEPQAAFYAWLVAHEQEWRPRVAAHPLVLVIDVGGGTTDLSLIAARASRGELGLERVAVGEHLLLGGDNMDIALARAVE